MTKRLLLLALIALLAACAHAPPESSSLNEDINTLVPAMMDKHQIPGFALAVVTPGGTRTWTYGVADIDGGEPVDADSTLFRVGSITKVFTAMAIARQVDAGDMNLDASLQARFPKLPLTGSTGHPVRLQHLLGHTAGFDQLGMNRQAPDKGARTSLPTFLQNNLRLIRDPGELPVYDTYGMTLAGLALEQLHAKPYPALMRDDIFIPLGMYDTWVEAPTAARQHLATGYGLENGRLLPLDYEWYVTTPASSIDSTANDMASFIRALLSGHDTWLSETMRQRLLCITPETRMCEGPFAWGFWKSRHAGVLTLEHGGMMAGYTSQLMLIPAKGVGYFFAYNRDDEYGPRTELRAELNELLLNAFLPSEETTAVAAVRDIPFDPKQYTGAYANTLACFTCDEGEGWALSSLPIRSNEDGQLLFRNGEPMHIVAKDEFLNAKTGEYMRFVRDDAGNVRYLIAGHDSYARLDEILLVDILGPAWDSTPRHRLVARVHLANQKWQAAAEAYADVARRQPDNGRVHYYHGYALLQDGQAAAAATAFEQASGLKQWLPWSEYYRSSALAAAGKQQAAVDALRQAIDAGFSDTRLIEADPNWRHYLGLPQVQRLLSSIK